jgi:hypothetical protein
MRRPEIHAEDLTENRLRRRLLDFNGSMQKMHRAMQIIGRGSNKELASQRGGMRRLWLEDEVTGKQVAFVLRDGTLEEE